MSSTKQSILIVDDEAEILEFLTLILSAEGFDSIKASSGKEALTILENNEGHIQAILSDVHMPDIDGYEFCKAVRADQRFQHLPFIFISALTNLEEKLTGYSAGADDYISKPIIEPQELLAKTRYFIENKLQHATLNKQVSDSFQTTMQAMTYSSHLGAILLFLQDASQLSELSEVADKLFEAMDSIGANAVIQFITENGPVSFRKDGMVSPLEANIIQLARNKGRFFDYEARTIINYDKFSLFIKNMPVDDPKRNGVLKDILGNLCNAINSVTDIIYTKELNSTKVNAMSDVLYDLT